MASVLAEVASHPIPSHPIHWPILYGINNTTYTLTFDTKVLNRNQENDEVENKKGKFSFTVNPVKAL